MVYNVNYAQTLTFMFTVQRVHAETTRDIRMKMFFWSLISNFMSITIITNPLSSQHIFIP